MIFIWMILEAIVFSFISAFDDLLSAFYRKYSKNGHFYGKPSTNHCSPMQKQKTTNGEPSSSYLAFVQQRRQLRSTTVK